MEQLDPEMLKNLDLLLDMDVVESESDWDTVEQIEEVASTPDDDAEEEGHE